MDLRALLPVILLTLALSACGGAAPTPTAPSPPRPPAPSASFALTSTAFEPEGPIPERYGHFRDDVSPPLAWESPPQGTRSLVLFLEDWDAPGGLFVHWVLYDIPPTASGLPEGVPRDPELSDGSRQGKNSAGSLGYIGPYPPPGETHRYTFVLYALDTRLDLPAGVTREQVLKAMEGHVLAQATLVGTYRSVQP